MRTKFHDYTLNRFLHFVFWYIMEMSARGFINLRLYVSKMQFCVMRPLGEIRGVFCVNCVGVDEIKTVVK